VIRFITVYKRVMVEDVSYDFLGSSIPRNGASQSSR
jgi:hypothetical protein